MRLFSLDIDHCLADGDVSACYAEIVVYAYDNILWIISAFYVPRSAARVVNIAKLFLRKPAVFLVFSAELLAVCHLVDRPVRVVLEFIANLRVGTVLEPHIHCCVLANAEE